MLTGILIFFIIILFVIAVIFFLFLILVYIDDLLQRPTVELDKMSSFLGLKLSRDFIDEVANEYISELESNLHVHTNSLRDDIRSLPHDLIRVGISAIESEFLASNNLNK